MAEAHQAVAFQFTVTPEGLDFHLSREAVKQFYLTGISSWKKRLVRAKVGRRRVPCAGAGAGAAPSSEGFAAGRGQAAAREQGCVPTAIPSPRALGMVPGPEAALTLPSVGARPAPRDRNGAAAGSTRTELAGSHGTWPSWHCCSRLLTYESRTMVSAALFSTGVWLSAVLLFRQALKLLLSYHGWMFEPHGKMSRSTKIWVALMKVLSIRKPLLYSFQTSLPKLPVPPVEATITRYLESVRPLMDDEKYSKMEVLAKEFKEKTAPRLQKYLILKSWWTTNYEPQRDGGHRQSRTLTAPGAGPWGHPWVGAVACVGVVGSGGFAGRGLEGARRMVVDLGIASPPRPDAGGAGRVPWAEARARFFSHGKNKASLDAIERAAFFLTLDEEEHGYSPGQEGCMDAYAKSLLHGQCYDRWFDKSFTLVVYKNGKLGANAEHSWADAPIIGHLWEGTPKLGIPLLGAVGSQGLPGGAGTSWASPQDKGCFCLTYEASMTRLFREGRTETVRSCTAESTAFVRSMGDARQTRAERQRLFKLAADKHQHMYRMAMTGAGIDRHLFCLYVVSRYLGVESPFLAQVLSEPWRLSTSQTPQQQLKLCDLNKHPDHVSTGGGFGPVADDGYGVSYIIAGENLINFHVSSKFSSSETDSKRFGRNIRQAMLDIAELFDKPAEKARK
ncbi:PREDICTED: carnitine O-palmitoyltransferase 1, muscle isoform [Nipponia nippon]|uniref:carnitine O-palmitoyltransferase 1, muscle isoform n=1 Tax=Nipponia nippon TaxID=128390 RepID=UPI0005112350|nr:PREDICTED: carnitine O-palmitoyltransferase 1, muscle isoform [Nipponia nippon]